MKKILFASAVILWQACLTPKITSIDSLVGEYSWGGIYGVGGQITLKSDSTYHYSWQVGLDQGYENGTWKLQEKQVDFHPIIEPDPFPNVNYLVLDSSNSPSDSLKIEIKEVSHHSPIPFYTCELKKDSVTIFGTSSDFDGIAYLPINNADTVIITCIGYRPIKHPVTQSITFYQFSMIEGKRFSETLKGKTLTLRKNRLHDRSIKKSKYVRTNYYEKLENPL